MNFHTVRYAHQEMRRSLYEESEISKHISELLTWVSDSSCCVDLT